MSKNKRKRNAKKNNKKYWNWAWFIGFGSLVVVIVAILLSGFNFKMSPISTSVVQPQERFNNTNLNPEKTQEEMLKHHSIARQMTVQISLAEAFIVIAEANNNLQFARELRDQLLNAQALLSNAEKRKTPLTVKESETTIHKMTVLLYKSQKLHNYDILSTITAMKEKVQSLEEQIIYGNRAAEEFPKGLDCLAVNLTMSKQINSFFSLLMTKPTNSSKRDVSIFKMKLKNNRLHHFCIFSDNILATSAVVNSTVSNSKKAKHVVFHIVTDDINYDSMQFWFKTNSFCGASIEVQKVEDFIKHYENRSGRIPYNDPNPKYPNKLNYLRFYIPDVFPALSKIVFLDDDVVVQKDLAPLFAFDMQGKVIGAVERCSEEFKRYSHYFNFSDPLISAQVDPDTCTWRFGVNIFNLTEWRIRNLTGVYHNWMERNVKQRLWKKHGMLPPGLLAFHGLIKTLDPIWHIVGLGYTDIDHQVIEKGAVLQFNGNPKPWFRSIFERYRQEWDSGNSKPPWSDNCIENHRPLWEKYVNYSHPLLWKCFNE